MQSMSSHEFQKQDVKEDGELTDNNTEIEDGELTDSSTDPEENEEKSIAEHTDVSKIPKRKSIATHFIGGKKIENLFDFYVIIDFEGTCGILKNPRHIKGGIQEIIEFPAILLNCHNRLIVDEFQSFCQPVLNPSLTNFCKKFTGITQEDVDKAPLFKDVFASFERWLQRNKLIDSTYSFAIVTDGPNDISQFLKNQCAISEIDFPTYCNEWINIKKTFACFYKNGNMQCLSLKNMIRDIGCDFQGRAHSGIDDARNIAVIVQRLLTDGARVTFNENIAFHEKNKTILRSVTTSVSTQANPVEIRNSKNLSSSKMTRGKNPAKKTVPAKKAPAQQTLEVGVPVKNDKIKAKKRRKRNAKRQINKEQVIAKNFKTADNTKTTKLIEKKLKLAVKKVKNLEKKLKSQIQQGFAQ